MFTIQRAPALPAQTKIQSLSSLPRRLSATQVTLLVRWVCLLSAKKVAAFSDFLTVELECTEEEPSGDGESRAVPAHQVDTALLDTPTQRADATSGSSGVHVRPQVRGSRATPLLRVDVT